MTFIELEYANDQEGPMPDAHPSVRCSWCGALISLSGTELALAMCKSCYEGMLAEFLREQHMNHTPTHPSDR